MSAGDYWLFRSGNAQIRNLETAGQFAKGRHWRAFLRVSAALSLSAALPGWRRSADRTCLQANSLLTGNFTGNFVIFGPQKPFSLRETAVLQRLLAQFPKLFNREKIAGNREFLSANREFHRNRSNREAGCGLQLFSYQIDAPHSAPKDLQQCWASPYLARPEGSIPREMDRTLGRGPTAQLLAPAGTGGGAFPGS